MGRTASFKYWAEVFLRMGEITIVDFAHRLDGRPVGSDKVVRLDPAIVGKAIHRHAVPGLAFTADKPGLRPGEHFRIDIARARAVGAPNPGNLDRTSGFLHVRSDGHEARFSGRGPYRSESDHSTIIDLDSRLSPNSPVYEDLPIHPPNPFWVAPWGDAEMLGHAVLMVFGLAGPPIGKGMMPSILDSPQPRRRTALHHAAMNGDIDTLPFNMSQSRRKVDPTDSAGVTPLMLASEKGHVDAVERLLALGAAANSQDDQGRSPLHYASRSGRDAAIDRLLEAGADPSASDMFGDTPLHLASDGGFMRSVELLLEAGADPTAADFMYLSTPLHRAARGYQVAVIAALVDSGADINAPNEAGRTALHVAAAYGHVEMARTLTEFGGDLVHLDLHRETPLHRAVFFQHLEMIALLIELGASVTSEDENGNTALHIAASMNRDAASRLMIEAGADVEAKNHEGLTALDLAIINQHQADAMEHNAEVAELLLEYDATLVPERIPVADRHALWPHLTPKDLLLATGDIDYSKLPDLPENIRGRLSKTDELGNPNLSIVMAGDTLLHDAAQKNLAGLVERLLKSGASVATAVRMHGTPLHSVARYGTCEMAALLLDWGADLEMPASNPMDGRHNSHATDRYSDPTPLDVALYYRSPRQEMAAFLLARGAKPFLDD